MKLKYRIKIGISVYLYNFQINALFNILIQVLLYKVYDVSNTKIKFIDKFYIP